MIDENTAVQRRPFAQDNPAGAGGRKTQEHEQKKQDAGWPTWSTSALNTIGHALLQIIKCLLILC